MSASGSSPPAPSVRITRNAAAVITSVDNSIVEVLGWRPDQLVGRASTGFIHPEDQPSAITAWFDMIAAPGSTQTWRGRYQGADGGWKWVESVNVNHLEDEDDPLVLTSMTLITVDQVSSEEELRARKQLLTRLSDALPLGVFEIDASRQIKFTNDRLHAIVGCPPAATAEAQFSTVVAEDRALLDAALAAVLADQPIDDTEIRLRLAQAEPRATAERVCLLSLRALTDDTGVVSGAIGCLSDVTDRVQLRRQLELRASVDDLTACMNRAATIELLSSTLAQPDAEAGAAVVFIDLDRFKAVNDLLGHAAGDRLLVLTAERLRAAVRGCDRIGRLGGDEFLVICPGVESQSKALEIGKRLAAALTATVDVGAGIVDLRASVGVAWTDERLDPDSFIAQADSAMYESKRLGEATVALFGVPVDEELAFGPAGHRVQRAA
jgi:diguanylate cyclase (GGDEF)-like protein